MVERRSLHSSMRDSVAPHSSAMYSVWPVKGRPESVTASLFKRRRHHGFGLAAEAHFGSDADVLHGGHATAGIQPAEGKLLDTDERARILQFRRSGIPVTPPAISNTAASPTTIQRARSASSGSATACTHDFGADAGGIAHRQARWWGGSQWWIGAWKKSAT